MTAVNVRSPINQWQRKSLPQNRIDQRGPRSRLACKKWGSALSASLLERLRSKYFEACRSGSLLMNYCAISILALATFASAGFAQVTTSQYDNFRTGANLHERTLTPQNVNARQFGKLGAFQVDGPVYAQPLFIPNVEIPGKGAHDVLYVATEHDSVYAFDANRPGDPPLWHVSFLDKTRGVTVPSEDDVQCPFIRPEVGITSTPVIDLKTGTLYALARTKIRHPVAPDEFFQHLHALAITTGAEKFGGPRLISASVLGNGRGSEKGHITFDPLKENPRAAL